MMETEEVRSENRMGTQPIGKLLFTMAFPLIISMLVQAFYNIVDSLYVSRLNQAAFNAVSLSYPIQNIMSAIASGTGIGLVALISRSLGEKNYKKANMLANNGVFLALCSYLLMVLFTFVGLDAFFYAQTDIPEIIAGGKAYLTICCLFSFGQFGQVVFERLLQSVGKSHFSMYILLTGAILNIVLDPLLIFGWGPFPEMGVAGAAAATVTGQICSMLVGIVLNLRHNKEIRLQFRHFRPSGSMILSIYKIGVPSMLTIGIGSVMTFMMNRLLIAIESTATAAAVFGAYFKIQSFFNMPVIGLSHGMNPIIGYNLGAGNKERMLKTYRLSLGCAFVYMFLGTMIFILVPGMLLGIFSASDQMLEIGIPAFRIIAIAFTISAYSLVTSQFFMACGRSFLALLMSVARQLVVLIPLAYLLGYTLGYSYVWFALPIGELGSVAMAIYGRMRIQKDIIDRM
ncbi:MAG: MATE family efflux transporter [Lachnospiraceae bacterium]|nr:MATE family efflux transporter [Lachnospiraceae bacterium]